MKRDELVKRKNIGWIQVAKLKEFLKVKRTDVEKGNFPDKPEKFSTSFLDLEDFYRNISEASLHFIANAVCPQSKKKFLEEKFHEQLVGFHRKQSSISSIYYYSLTEKEQEEIEKNSNNDSQNPEEHSPSAVHCDTGILSFIVCSDVPGLQGLFLYCNYRTNLCTNFFFGKFNHRTPKRRSSWRWRRITLLGRICS